MSETYRGPSGRVISLDNYGGTPTDISIHVRSITGVEEIEAHLEDVTGPAELAPDFRATGFATYGDIVMEVDWSDGSGTWDVRSDIAAHMPLALVRTLTVTTATSQTYSGELFINKCAAPTPNMGETHYTLTCKLTGVWTVG